MSKGKQSCDGYPDKCPKDVTIRLRQFASLCRERRYQEAAKFVASIENVWDVWPLMRSLFREWARDAAELRHDVDAYYVTGLCLRYGMGVKKDVSLAMQAFRIAGRRGHVDACRQLGECHAENGHWPWAIVWYRKAAKAGHAKTAYYLKRIEEDNRFHNETE